MKTEEKTFTFRLPALVLEAVQKIADEQDLSVAQLMRRLLKKLVDEQGSLR